jgi:hypothetical protein
MLLKSKGSIKHKEKVLKCGSKYSVAVQLSQRCETWEGVAGDGCDLVVVEVPEMERKKGKA